MHLSTSVFHKRAA